MEAQPAYGVQPHELPSYLERVQSELPALHLLMQIGWQYLTPDEANRPGGRRA
jgi:type I restriction enzyme, R subunit